MAHTITFDSAAHPAGEVVTLACGFESVNEITFVNEAVTVRVDARTGAVAFFDGEGHATAETKVALPSGDERFSELRLAVDGARLVLGFPRYTYEDNYPHCDGEHDRWTKRITGYDELCYDITEKRPME